MENAITVGLSRQIVLAHALDVTANNVANQTTAGFKAEKVAFREYLMRLDGPDAGDPTVSLAHDPDSYTDFTPGGLQSTGAPLDFAIDGDGFFAVSAPSGVRYTRDGHFGLSEFGELVTRDGHPVLDDGSNPILIDPDAGPLLVSPQGELQQDGVPIARIGVFAFEDTRALTKTGANLFAAAEEPTPRETAIVRQGFVELSNVQPIVAMTDMMEIMRAYETTAQLIETSGELAREAVRTLTATT